MKTFTVSIDVTYQAEDIVEAEKQAIQMSKVLEHSGFDILDASAYCVEEALQ